MKMDIDDLLDYQKQSMVLRGGSSYQDKESVEQQIQAEQAEYFATMVNDVKGDLKDIVTVIKSMKHQFISDQHDHKGAWDVYNMVNRAVPKIKVAVELERKASVERTSPGHAH